MRIVGNGWLSRELRLLGRRGSEECIFSISRRGNQLRAFSSNFDIFKKLQDPPKEEGADSKRKPSERVLRLVDEVLSLSLLEAADLCDLCQEKLAERGGGPTFAAAVAAGRSPFPHPSAMFSAAMQMPFAGGAMPMAFPAAGSSPPQGSSPSPPPGGAASASGDGESNAGSAKPAAEAARTSYTLRLLGFEATKKVAVVKEVRALTALGLKEAKELVEAAPKIIKKGVPAAEADALKAKLEAAGAKVALE